MQNKIACLGDENSILLMKSVGVDPFVAKSTSNAEKLLKTLAQSYSIVFVTNSVALNLEKTIREYDSLVYPIILTIPSKFEKDSYGITKIREIIKTSLGMKINN